MISEFIIYIPYEIRIKYKKIADERFLLHKYHDKYPFKGKHGEKDYYNYYYFGLLGEYAFARIFDLKVDLKKRFFGDKGIDFIINGTSIDIKTAVKPYYLLAKKHKEKDWATIFVLAKYEKDKILDYDVEVIHFLGWEYSYKMKEQDCKTFGYNSENYYKGNWDLRSMNELKIIISKLKEKK